MRYDANVNATACIVATSAEKDILQMTTGCALVLLIGDKQTIGRSFTTIKNRYQWTGFAERNTNEVQRLLDMKCNAWTGYDWNGATWYFNLRGYVWNPKEGIVLQMDRLEYARIKCSGIES